MMPLEIRKMNERRPSKPRPGPIAGRVEGRGRPEAEAFDAAAFVDAHYADLHRWLWWLTGSSHTAADLTQEAFAGFWRASDPAGLRDPRGWLYSIARNQWRKRVRDERRRAAAPLPDERALGGPASSAPRGLDAADAAPDAALLRDERIAAMHAALAALPAPYREAIVLRHAADLTYAEMERVLGAPAVLLRWRVHKAAALLRARLGDHDSAEGASR